MGRLWLVGTRDGWLAEVACRSCDARYRVCCPRCMRYMIGLTARSGRGQDSRSAAHGRDVAGRSFFKCEGCGCLMDYGNQALELDEKRREAAGWSLWYGVADRWRETRRAWRTAFGIVQATRIRQALAIAGLPFRFSLLLIHSVVALPLFAALRLIDMALRLAFAAAGIGIVAILAWMAWTLFMG